MLGTTMRLAEMVDSAIARYQGEAVAMSWAPAEPERADDPVEPVLDGSLVSDDDEPAG